VHESNTNIYTHKRNTVCVSGTAVGFSCNKQNNNRKLVSSYSKVNEQKAKTANSVLRSCSITHLMHAWLIGSFVNGIFDLFVLMMYLPKCTVLILGLTSWHFPSIFTAKL